MSGEQTGDEGGGEERKQPIPRLNRDRSERRGELADPAVAERLKGITGSLPAPPRVPRADRGARRRGRAGLGAAARQARLAGGQAAVPKPYPSPRNMPIDTFVVLMMENRSFDHYFGWHPAPMLATRGSPTRTPRASRSRPTI